MPTPLDFVSASFSFDVHSRGEHWFSDHADPWTIGVVVGTTRTISPPRVE